ncbi:MAG TPA: glycosyltransferase family 4 protein, partial [bacterium]
GLTYSFSAHAKDIYLQDPELLHLKSTTASFVVTCTEHNRQYLQQVSGKDVPVFRSYHGVNLEVFSMPTNSESDFIPRILSVGRLVPKKGFAVLVEALSLLRQKGFPFRCIIIGSGSLESSLRYQISNLGLEDCVELRPPVSQGQLRDYCYAASLFALACEVQSDGDRDGIPNVVVEAMATGLPVVSTNISGIPECVEHGVTGLLVPEKDPVSFSDAMAQLLGDPELAHQFGRAGRKRVEEFFDVTKNVTKIGVLLQQAIERSEVSPAFANADVFVHHGNHVTSKESRHAAHTIAD